MDSFILIELRILDMHSMHVLKPNVANGLSGVFTLVVILSAESVRVFSSDRLSETFKNKM